MKKNYLSILLALLVAIPVLSLASSSFYGEYSKNIDCSASEVWNSDEMCALGAMTVMMDMQSEVSLYVTGSANNETLNEVYVAKDDSLINYFFFYDDNVWVSVLSPTTGYIQTDFTQRKATPQKTMQYLQNSGSIDKYKTVKIDTILDMIDMLLEELS